MENHESTKHNGVNPAPEQNQSPRSWLIQNGPYLIFVAALLGFLFFKFDVQGLSAILWVAVGLGLVIFIHELGHFLVAKWCDVHVETFSIGFGPALPGCKFKRGETTYMIALFPLGGYVKMVGEGTESEEDDDDPRSFKNKSVGQRMAIISAGVIMNVILACICFVVAYTHGMKRPPAVVGATIAGGSAWVNGIPAGADLVQLGERRPNRPLVFTDLRSEVLRSNRGDKLKIVYTYPPDPDEHVVVVEPGDDKTAGLPMVGLTMSDSVKLLPDKYRKQYQRPVVFGTPAAAARKPFEFRAGDVVLSVVDVDASADDRQRTQVLSPANSADPASVAQNTFELSQALQRLAGKPVELQILRKGKKEAEKLLVQPAEFEFGDTVIATTDPDHPDKVAPLPEDPRQPGSGKGDFFEFRRRLQRLAGQFMTIEVRRADGNTASLVVPPAYHCTLGARMKMGNIAALRDSSDAKAQGVEEGDVLTQIELTDGKETRTFVVSSGKDINLIDPVRLPYELQKWAGSHSGVKAKLTVQKQNSKPEKWAEKIIEVPWDGSDKWKYDRELALSLTAPMAIPELGIAYFVEAKVDAVVGPPADASGSLRKNDLVKKIRFTVPGPKWGESEPAKDFQKLELNQWASVFETLQTAEFKTVTLEVERDQEQISLQAVPDPTWPMNDRGLIMDHDGRIKIARDFAQAIVMGLEDTYRQVVDVYYHLRGMISGRISVTNIGGPITIGRVAYAVARQDFWEFIFLIGAISVNLAVINFMPIPVLDGGHMVFLVYEKLRGKPAPEQVRAVAAYIGLALIGCLMIFVLFLDVKKILSAMFKLALHSVSYSGVWGQAQLPLEPFLAKAAKLGFDAVMLMAKRPHLSLLDATSSVRRELKKRADDLGLRIAAIAAYNDFAVGAEVADVPLREMQVYYLGELARLAADLGCPLVRVFTCFDRESVPYQNSWGHAVSCLREAARRAADGGVTLGVQNHHDLAVHHDSLADLLDEIGEPNCKVCFDAWAPALMGLDPAEGVRKLARQVVHTTVADYVKRPRYRYLPPLVNYAPQPDAVRAVPMGQGFIDYRRFFAALAEIGYSGYVAYEMCSPLKGGGGEANLDRCATAFVDYMRSLQAKS